MSFETHSRKARAAVIVCCLALVSACAETPEPPEVPDELVVLTRNAPTTYFLDRNTELKGPEYDMATDFARFLNRPVRFEVLDSVSEVLASLEEGRGHIAAAGLTWTEGRAERFVAGPSYQKVAEQVVCNSRLRVDDLGDLVGRDLRVAAASSYEATLEETREAWAELSWKSVPERATEDLLYEVSEGVIDCTLADSNIMAVHQRYLPRIQASLVIAEEKDLVWLMAPEWEHLRDPVEEWLNDYRARGELVSLMNEYYGHLEEFDPYDVRLFVERVGDRLPEFRPIFEEAAARTGLPWTLLAAMSYQESQWDPMATSPTGVRGLMMLTEPTAKSLGVSDRLDPTESIQGGAEYLRRRVDGVPAYVPESDRLWMALAAYNIGQNHLRDARMLAVRLGENPNSWTGVKEVLPRLAQHQYYQDLPAGYARGRQPVIYVERVRNYRDILEGFLADNGEIAGGGHENVE